MKRARLVDDCDRWRVALLDPGDFTPAYDLALAQGLLRAGHDVRLIGKCGFDEAARPSFRREHFYRGLAHPRARQLAGPLFRSVKGVHHAFDMARLPGRLKEYAPDVIHSQWLPLPLVDRHFLPRMRRWAPLVITLHDSNPYNGAAGPVMRIGYMALVRAADAVIVHTAQAEARLAAAGVAQERVHRLPHGLLHAEPCLTEKHPRPGNRRLRLLQFGKIRPYKGVDVLLEALAQLSPEEKAALDIKIVGQPYIDTAPLQAFVHDHGLENTVEFRFGFIEEAEIARLFAGADAAVFPYREIDASGAAMTAVAHGLPVLASAIGGFREQFQDGREARLIPPGDAAALAGVLREWTRAPDALDRLADGMRVHRALVPNWTDIGLRTAGVYAAARSVWMSQRVENGGTSAECLTGPSLP